MTIQSETPPLATEATAPRPTQDERITAALAHIGIVLPLTGLLLPIFIWLTQKEKSAFVRFQALQALAWHLALLGCYFLGFGCYICSFFATFVLIAVLGATTTSHGAESSPLVGIPILLPFLVIMFLFAMSFIVIISGIVGAVLALQGKDFRFPIIGRQVEKFLAAK